MTDRTKVTPSPNTANATEMAMLKNVNEQVGRINIKKIRYIKEGHKKKVHQKKWWHYITPKSCWKKEEQVEEDELMEELNDKQRNREKALEMWDKLRAKLPKIIAMGKLN